jgi:hypothetical protein
MAELWRVTSQRPTEELNPGATGFVTVWEVTYEVISGPAQGAVGKVKIPAINYSAEAVKEAIDKEVDVVSEVASL